jgi:hypothetical protein
MGSKKLYHALIISLCLTASELGLASPLTIESPNIHGNGEFGFSVAGIRDVNGNGGGDIVVGAPFESSPSSPDYAGRAYIFDGLGGALIHEIVSPNERTYGHFGKSVSGVPDADGDGVEDVVIGAFGENIFGPESLASGRAYIFSGSTGAMVRSLISPDPEAEYFGTSVSGLSDIDGDLRGDVLVAAESEDPATAPINAGRVHVFSGSSGMLIRTLISPVEQKDGKFGLSISSVPDINGDGTNDIAVGSEEVISQELFKEGLVHLFDGVTGSFLATLQSPSGQTSGFFGISVSGIPDLSGDGLGGVIVGANGEASGGSPTRAGRAHLFNGQTGEWIRTLRSPNESVDGFFGHAVSGVEDLNGDGLGEVVVGAPLENTASGRQAGRAYVFDGATGAVMQTLSSTVLGAGGKFGFSLSRVPDVDGNGREELVVGSDINAFEPPPSFPSVVTLFFASDLDARPLKADFGTLVIGHGPADPVNITIENNGEDDLAFECPGIEITGQNAEDFFISTAPFICVTGPSAFPSGASVETTVSFLPKFPGERIAYLSVRTNDSDKPLIEIVLSGIGLNPTPTPPPTPTATPLLTPTVTPTTTPTRTPTRSPSFTFAPTPTETPCSPFDLFRDCRIDGHDLLLLIEDTRNDQRSWESLFDFAIEWMNHGGV